MSDPPRMSQSVLSSLAILKSNWDSGGRSYVDNFIPFIVDCLRASTGAQISVADIAKAMSGQFGMAMPEGVIQTALRRASRQGYGQRRDGAFLIDREAVEKINLDSERANAIRQVNALTSRLIQFATERHGFAFSDNGEAEELLRSFVDQHSVPMLRMMVTGRPAEPRLPLGVDPVYVINDFVLDLHERDPEGFRCLETLVKGSMLSTVLYLPSAGEVGRRFDRHTTLYLDTPVILSALGYEGEARAVAARELLELAYREGAGLACFEHTLVETRGVLNAVGSEMNRRGPRPERSGGVENHFLRLGYNASDIELVVRRLEQDLESRRIDVRARPPHRDNLTIDEAALERELQDKVGYAHRETLLTDLDSLTAIYRIRGGADQLFLESCRAVFVTSNPGVVQAGRAYFPVREQHSWPVALLDHDVATLLWLKRPMQAPELPERQIIADCYAALEPGSAVWARYLEEVDRLEERGDVGEDDFFFLRYSFEAKRALMDLTKGKPTGVTAQVVNQVIERVRDEMSAPVREALEAERRKREVAESSTDEALAKQEENARRMQELEGALTAARRSVENVEATITRRARSQVKWLKRGVAGILGIACLGGVWLGLPAAVGGSPAALGAEWRWVARVAVAIMILVTLYGAWFGGSVRSAVRDIDVRMTKWLERGRLRRAGLAHPEDAQSDSDLAGSQGR